MIQIPNIQYLVHESKVLNGNLMGDPFVRRVPIYIPPNYDEHRKEPFPVLFLLAGYSGRGARYLNDEGVFSEALPDILDRMILSKEMPPALVVFPDGGTKFGGSQYINSEANGRYMDYICDELVDFVDANFHTAKSPHFRGIAGHSSGGFGALVTGMIRPDRFLYVCSSAGDSAYDLLYTAPIPAMIRELKKAGGVEKFLKGYLSSPNPQGLKSRTEGETMMNLAMCTCYAPNIKNEPLKGDLYFDLETGELIPEVWKKFLAWDPVHMVERHTENIKKLKWIRLEAGFDDEYALHLGHRQIAKKLSKIGAPFEIEEYPGRHGGHHYRFAMRFQKMLAKMYL